MKKSLIIQLIIAGVLFVAGLCVLLGGTPGKTEYKLKEQPPAQTSQTTQAQTAASAETTTPSETTEPTQTTTAPTQAPFRMPEITWRTVPEDRQLTATQAFVYDAYNEDYLYTTGSTEDPLYIASITKLFTIHVASRYLEPDEEIRVERAHLEKVSANSSTAGLNPGEILTASQLYVGLLIPSGNDVAYVLATVAGRRIAEDPDLSVDGAIAAFVAEMNREAQALGMTGTHFTNPDGYHDDDHYTCPRDLVTIARLALENEAVAQYGHLTEATVTPVSGSEKQWRNLNHLADTESQYYCPYAVGLKTGYTINAGNCLLSAFDIAGRIYIIGVFGCPDDDSRFDDTLQLFNTHVIGQDTP